MRRLTFLLPLLLAALPACGSKTEEVEPQDWKPFLEAPVTLTINGQAFNAFVASTEAHRNRALKGLAIKEKQAIAYLFPKLERPAEMKFVLLTDPADIVFLDDKGKAIAVETMPAFLRGSMPHQFAYEGTRVVLQLPAGTTNALKISKGSDVKTAPDLVEQSAKAEPDFARLFFYKEERREEEKPKDSPFVSLKVLDKAEDWARAMKDRPDLKEGEGVILPVSSFHEFWLKGVEGKVCAAYIERAGQGGTVLSAIYEGIEDTGKTDLERPVYYSPASANYLAIWKGSDTFTKHQVERRARVVLAGVDSSTEPKIDYNNLGIKFGETRLSARLARTPSERATALLDAPTLKEGKALVLAWDDDTDVKIENAPASANLCFVTSDGKTKFSAGEKVKTAGGEVKVNAKSRFVIAMPPNFEAKGDLDFPWELRDLRPWLPVVAFYTAKQKDAVKDRWPTTKENLHALTRVELAISDSEQHQGLMFRTSLKKDHGMLFVYKKEQDELSYWMKNCKMNLAIAFVNERGEIIKIHPKMLAPEPGTPDAQLPGYDSGGPAKYAIEMDEDWFAKNGIKEGDRVFIPPELAALK